jgi:hypothetical protein
MTGAQLGLWYFTTMCLASCVRRVKKELPGVFDIIHCARVEEKFTMHTQVVMELNWISHFLRLISSSFNGQVFVCCAILRFYGCEFSLFRSRFGVWSFISIIVH